jgi:hypothetical protein
MKITVTEVAEDFLGFVWSNTATAATITDALLKKLKLCGICLGKWKGDGFDGTATMVEHVSGVATRIQRELRHSLPQSLFTLS